MNYEITSHGEKFSFNGENWNQEFTDYLLHQALKVLLDRSSASLTKKDGHTDKQRLEACQKVAKRLQAGEMPTRGFGGGGSVSDEDHAMREWLVKAGIKRVKGESLETHLSRYVQVQARNAGKDYLPEMDSKVAAAIKTNELYKTLLAARKNKASDVALTVEL